jgi:hypothetical protein
MPSFFMRQLADLVEEDGPVARELEATDASSDGARERSLLMAHELAVEQPARVDRVHQGAPLPDRAKVSAGVLKS